MLRFAQAVCLIWTIAASRAAGPYQSLLRYTQLDPANAIGLAGDSSGNSFVVSALDPRSGPAYITKIAPDGAVIFRTVVPEGLSLNAAQIAAAPDGTFWLSRGDVLWKYDRAGKRVAETRLPLPIAALTMDSAGRLYAAGSTSPRPDPVVSVFALDDAGAPKAAYTLKGRAEPKAMAVDGAGAVYVTGSTNDRSFPTTPGAFMESKPTPPSDINTDVFVVKLSPDLKDVIYSTLIGGGRDDYAFAIAVDEAGSAIIGGRGTSVSDATPFPVTSVGVPGPIAEFGVAYVARLNPSGSALEYSTQVCGGGVYSLSRDRDGSVVALAWWQRFSYQVMAVLRLSATGDRVESARFFPGIRQSGASALQIGADGVLRILTEIQSPRFPVLGDDALPVPATPTLIDLPASGGAELSVAFESPRPASLGADAVFRVSVTNSGPDTAEWVTIYRFNSVGYEQLNGCASNAPVACQRTAVAIVPKILPGETVWVEYRKQLPGIGDAGLHEQVVVLAMSPERNLTDNIAEATAEIVKGVQVPFSGAPLDFKYYRSDAEGRLTSSDSVLRYVAAFPVTVTIPTPQRANGNWWRFDSWLDGSTENPRTFTERPTDFRQYIAQFQPVESAGVDPPSLNLVAWPGVTPAARSVTLYPTAAYPAAVTPVWSIRVPDVPWLRFSTKPGPLVTAIVNAEADIAGLTPGWYNTSFTASFGPPGKESQVVTVPVSLQILDKAPAIAEGGVVGATGVGTTIAPLKMITIYGSGLGPPEPLGGMPVEGQLPMELGGTTVWIDERQMLLVSVMENQVSAIVPAGGFAAGAPHRLRIFRGGALATSIDVQTAEVSPGLFTADNSGRGRLAALNADGSLNSPEHPAAKGSVITLFGTGFSGSDLRSWPQRCWEGYFGSNLPALVPTPVEATIGGRIADVLYAGSAQGVSCSIQRFELLIPEDSPTGSDVPVQVQVFDPTGYGRWVDAQGGLTVSIR